MGMSPGMGIQNLGTEHSGQEDEQSSWLFPTEGFLWCSVNTMSAKPGLNPSMLQGTCPRIPLAVLRSEHSFIPTPNAKDLFSAIISKARQLKTGKILLPRVVGTSAILLVGKTKILYTFPHVHGEMAKLWINTRIY